MSWQDFGSDDEEQYDDETPAVTLGDLRDGEGLTLTFAAEPEEFHSDDYGPGIRAEAEFHESDYTFTTEDGDRIEDGDEVVLVTWSKRLARALVGVAEDAGGLAGETVAITKTGTGYDTDYEAQRV